MKWEVYALVATIQMFIINIYVHLMHPARLKSEAVEALSKRQIHIAQTWKIHELKWMHEIASKLL